MLRNQFLFALIVVLIAIIAIQFGSDHASFRTITSKATEDRASCDQSGNCPTPVNVSKAKIEHLKLWNSGVLSKFKCRYFDMDYLEYLSKAASTVAELVTVIIGRKDAGKSSGLRIMFPLWRSVGHLVIDVNLKSEMDNVTAAQVMPFIAKQLDEELSRFSPRNYKCIYQYFQQQCPNASSVSFEFKFMWWVILCSFGLLSLVGTTVYIVYQKEGMDGLLKIYNSLHVHRGVIFTLFLITTGLTCFSFIIANTFYPQLIYETIESLNLTVSSGDWRSLICYLNGISLCVPMKRPILVLRDITKFESETLRTSLQSLAQAKELTMHFPVFIETSDYYYFHSSQVTQSLSSFNYYELQNLNYSTVENIFAHEHHHWDKNSLDYMYKKLGGLMGLYSLMYKRQQITGLDIPTLIEQQEIQYLPIVKEIKKLRFKVLCPVFELLIKSNFTIPIGKPDDPAVIDIIVSLIKKNVLFYGLDDISPQNMIIQHHIVNLTTNYC